MPRVFISRSLSPDSVFLRSLSEQGWQIVGESLVEFAPEPFDELPTADWCFFYSQKGVEFFFKQLKLKQIYAPKTLRWAAIGQATGDALKGYVPKVHFVGTGEPQSTALLFRPLSEGQRVLFVQASNSRQSVELLLPDSVKKIRLSVYSNRIRTDYISLPDEVQVLVFTSPLNAQAYLDKIPNPKQKIVCIGQTTAQKLQEYGITDVLVADSPNEQALSEAVLNCF